MNIKLILNELKKIFKFRNVVVAVCVFLFLGFLTVFRDVNSVISKFDTENYPEQIPLDLSHYSVELKFKDTLLKKYGETIDADELPLVKEELQKFEKQVDSALRNDEILKSAGFNADTRHYEGLREVSPEVEQYCFTVTEGFYKYDGTDYPVYFENGFREVVNYMETAAEQGKPQVYHVMSDTFDYEIGEDLSIILFAVAASLFIVVPYMVSENKSKTALFEYSSKIGRKSYGNKIAAVAVSQFITVGIGALIAAAYFLSWNVSRYYNCKIDTSRIINFIDNNTMPQEYYWPIVSSKCYSGLTLLELYILLLLGVSLCGILTLLLAAIIAYHFDNIFAPFAIGLLLLSIPIAFYERAVITGLNLSSMFSDGSEMLTTKYEPFIFIAVLIAVTVIAVVIEIRKKKKKEI